MIGVELLLGQNLVKSISLFLVLLLILTTIPTHDEKKDSHNYIPPSSFNVQNVLQCTFEKINQTHFTKGIFPMNYS